jgi:hypothetical protein
MPAMQKVVDGNCQGNYGRNIVGSSGMFVELQGFHVRRIKECPLKWDFYPSYIQSL